MDQISSPLIPSFKVFTKKEDHEDPQIAMRRKCIEDILNYIGKTALYYQSPGTYTSIQIGDFSQLLKNDPYCQTYEQVQAASNDIPLGLGWRMKDFQRKEELVLQDEKIRDAIKNLELWIKAVNVDLETVSMQVPDKSSYKSILDETQNRYSNQASKIALLEVEINMLLKEIEERINYVEKDTVKDSYWLLHYAHDVSLDYLVKNRADYKKNTQFFTEQKKVLQGKQKALSSVHQVFKDKLCELGNSITGTPLVLSFADPISTSQQFRSISLLEMGEPDLKKVEQIFVRLLKTRERLVEEHVSNEAPIPLIEKDPVGFVLRVVEDWTPCLNHLVSKEITVFSDQLTSLEAKFNSLQQVLASPIQRLHDMIKGINQKQEDENEPLKIFAEQAETHREIVREYRALIEGIDQRIAKAKIKPKGASEETYVAMGRSHDISASKIKSNVSTFLDIEPLEETKKKAKIGYDALCQSFETFTDLVKKYQGMKGTAPESWTRWAQELNYSYWYPSS